MNMNRRQFLQSTAALAATIALGADKLPDLRPPVLILAKPEHSQLSSALSAAIKQGGNACIVDNPKDLDAAKKTLDSLANQPGVTPKRLGIVAIGRAGEFAAMLGGTDPRIWKIVFCSYAPAGDALDTLKVTEAPLLMIYGTKDPDVTAEKIAASRRALEDSGGINVDVLAIEGADHSFTSQESQKQLITETLRWMK